ncbi:MAG TPA: hypothetical protein VKQ32_03960 [Polyangia bacterium]|nr:hypothetical protein [Polyangia bacterium]
MRIIVASVVAFLLALQANAAQAADSPAPPNLMPANALLRLNATGTAIFLAPDVDAQCAKLDAQQTAWGTLSVLTTALTGTSGLGTLAVGDNHQNWKVAIGVSTVVLGALGAVSAYLTTHYSDRYKSYGCVPPTATTAH